MPASIGRVSTRSSVASTPLSAAARSWAQGFNFGSASAVRRLAVPRASAPSTGPEAVQRAYALYSSWEARDLGSARLLEAKVDGKDVFALHTTTDGDEGFLELYDAKGAALATGTTGFDQAGKRTVRWDATPLAVRERVVSKDGAASVQDFFAALEAAKRPTSSSGATVTATELRAAARTLVGSELTTASVDGFENSALFRVLADPAAKLTPTARREAEQLGNLYLAGAPALSRQTKRPVGPATAWARAAEVASAAVGARGGPPGATSMVRLANESWNQLPSQLVPISRAEAQKLVLASGASLAEAKAAVAALADAKGTLFAGRLFEQGTDFVPKAKGPVLFGVAADGRALKALKVPSAEAPATDTVPKAIIARLLGVERELEVLSRQVTPRGEEYGLRWRPPTGGLIEAKLTVPTTGEPTLADVTVPPPIDVQTAAGLAARLQTALGSPRTVLAHANVPSATVAFVAAHRPASGGPLTLSKIDIESGGASATVTPKAMGTSAADRELARALALQLARGQAQRLVSDPSIAPAARLEVALRTAWATPADLVEVDPADSAVGFDPATDRTQLMLPRVWGDNAVFVTFARNGAIRLEDFN